MKIAIIVKKFPCPSETFILNQITGIINFGHEVHVYASKAEDSPKIYEDLEKYNLSGKVFYFNYGREKIPQNKILRLAKAFDLLYELRQKGLWSLLRSLNVVQYGMAAASLSLFYQAAALMRNGPYDIVHCHFGPLGQIAAALKDTGIIRGKVITTFHGFDISTHIKTNGRDVYNSLFKHGDLCLPISEKWKNELLQLGCPPEKIVIHRMGVDLARFAFCSRRKKDRKNLRILSIARFVEKKGLEYGICAIARVVQQYPKLKYQIVGDGILRERLEQLIKDLNLEENVQLLGWKEHWEVDRLMEDAHIFLAPSVTAKNGDQEGIPVVIMEAMAKGLPVVSTFHSGIPELIQDHKSGFLVPEGDAEAIAQKLQYLCQHPEKSAEMSRVGRDWVERYYDINKLNDQLVKLYARELCKSSR